MDRVARLGDIDEETGEVLLGNAAGFGAGERAGDRGVMVGGRGVRLASESVVATADMFLCISVDAGRRGERSESIVRQASAIEREWLPATTRSVEMDFDESTECVVAFSRVRYRDLVLEEKPAPNRCV